MLGKLSMLQVCRLGNRIGIFAIGSACNKDSVSIYRL